jgi:hypothetical protein
MKKLLLIAMLIAFGGIARGAAQKEEKIAKEKPYIIETTKTGLDAFLGAIFPIQEESKDYGPYFSAESSGWIFDHHEFAKNELVLVKRSLRAGTNIGDKPVLSICKVERSDRYGITVRGGAGEMAYFAVKNPNELGKFTKRGLVIKEVEEEGAES